jgi:hypothetical protein
METKGILRYLQLLTTILVCSSIMMFTSLFMSCSTITPAPTTETLLNEKSALEIEAITIINEIKTEQSYIAKMRLYKKLTACNKKLEKVYADLSYQISYESIEKENL